MLIHRVECVRGDLSGSPPQLYWHSMPDDDGSWCEVAMFGKQSVMNMDDYAVHAFRRRFGKGLQISVEEAPNCEICRRASTPPYVPKPL